MPTLEIADSCIDYLDLGRGEPAVLLHGSGSSNAQWRALAEQLSTRYRVLAPDFYGCGTSGGWPGSRAFQLDCDAEIVLALLSRLGERTHLVGHSYGGAVALHVARRHGDSLRSLTLIEPAAFHVLKKTDTALAAEITEVAESMAHAILCGEYVAGFGQFVDYWGGPQAWAQVPQDKRYAMAARLPKVMLDFHATFNASATLEDFHSIAVPTLLVAGTVSPRPTRRIAELLAQTLPAAQLTALTGAGHMAPVTHRDQVNALVASHLDSNSGHLSRRHAVAENPTARNTARVARSAA